MIAWRIDYIIFIVYEDNSVELHSKLFNFKDIFFFCDFFHSSELQNYVSKLLAQSNSSKKKMQKSGTAVLTLRQEDLVYSKSKHANTFSFSSLYLIYCT